MIRMFKEVKKGPTKTNQWIAREYRQEIKRTQK
jgi:hypothetical protein